MATKNNPGKYDCYENALPDEPIFTLRANDELAPDMVNKWAHIYIKFKSPTGKIEDLTEKQREKVSEAFQCERDMRKWKKSKQEDVK